MKLEHGELLLKHSMYKSFEHQWDGNYSYTYPQYWIFLLCKPASHFSEGTDLIEDSYKKIQEL